MVVSAVFPTIKTSEISISPSPTGNGPSLMTPLPLLNLIPIHQPYTHSLLHFTSCPIIMLCYHHPHHHYHRHHHHAHPQVSGAYYAE